MKRGSAEKLRPCPRNGASWRAGVGRVGKLAFLTILQECFLIVPHARTTEILVCQHSFPTAC